MSGGDQATACSEAVAEVVTQTMVAHGATGQQMLSAAFGACSDAGGTDCAATAMNFVMGAAKWQAVREKEFAHTQEACADNPLWFSKCVACALCIAAAALRLERNQMAYCQIGRAPSAASQVPRSEVRRREGCVQEAHWHEWWRSQAPVVGQRDGSRPRECQWARARARKALQSRTVRRELQ